MGSRRANECPNNKSARSIAPLYIGRSGISKEIGKLTPRFRSPLNAAAIWPGTHGDGKDSEARQRKTILGYAKATPASGREPTL
jgi:hypothetical protein